jgi:hypothetical protein
MISMGLNPRSGVVWGFVVLVSILGTDVAIAQDKAALDRASQALERVLPKGWTIAQRAAGEIPWGHHWCDSYSGPTGTKVIALGTKDVKVHLRDQDGKWSSTQPAAKESLELWLMPGEYSESRLARQCHHRPIPPVEILSNAFVRVFGRPSHRLNSEKEFYALIEKANGSSWPDSPYNDPSTFSWRTWRTDLASALRQEFSK